MSDKSRKICGEGGFTLVELAVIVAIASILMAIAIAGYLSWKPGYVFRDAVSTIRGGLERAKMRAVETRKQCKVVFDTDSYEIYDGNYVMHSSDWGNVDSDGEFTDGTPYRTVYLDDYAGISITDSSATRVIFSPRGSADGLGTIYVEHSDVGEATIKVTIAGNINIDWP